jgi:hypothetical protein
MLTKVPYYYINVRLAAASPGGHPTGVDSGHRLRTETRSALTKGLRPPHPTSPNPDPRRHDRIEHVLGRLEPAQRPLAVDQVREGVQRAGDQGIEAFRDPSQLCAHQREPFGVGSSRPVAAGPGTGPSWFSA